MVWKEAEIKEQLKILCFVIFTRLFFYFKYFIDPQYLFPNGLPYYFKYDSYFFASILESHGFTNVTLYILNVYLLCMLALVIYNISRIYGINKNWSVLTTMLITMLPSFFSQTLIGFIDTPVIIFLSATMFLYGNLLMLKKLKIGCLYILIALLLSFLWTGQNLLLTIFIIQTIIFIFFKKGLCFNKKFFVLLIMSGLITATLLFNRISGVVAIKMRGVGEYLPNTFVVFYVVLFFVLMIIWKHKKITQKELLLIVPGIAMTIGALIVQRFTALAFIYIGLLYGYYLSNKELSSQWYKYIILVFILFNAFVWTYPPTVNDEVADLFVGLSENDTLLTFWEYGHITNYFSKAKTTSIANPLPNDKAFIYAINTNEDFSVGYLDNKANFDYYTNNTAYYILIDDYNIGQYDYFESVGHYKNHPFNKSNNSIIYKAKNNIKSEYYKTIKVATLRDRNFYLLQRLGK